MCTVHASMGFAQRKCLTFSPPYFFFFFFPPLEKDYLKREGFTETLAKFQAEANTVLGAVTLVSDMSPCAPLSCATAVLILLQKKLSLFFHQRMLHGIPQLQLYLLHCKCTTLPRVEPAATNTSPPPDEYECARMPAGLGIAARIWREAVARNLIRVCGLC